MLTLLVITAIAMGIDINLIDIIIAKQYFNLYAI